MTSNVTKLAWRIPIDRDPPPPVNECLLVRHGGAHGVTRPTPVVRRPDRPGNSKKAIEFTKIRAIQGSSLFSVEQPGGIWVLVLRVPNPNGIAAISPGLRGTRVTSQNLQP